MISIIFAPVRKLPAISWKLAARVALAVASEAVGSFPSNPCVPGTTGARMIRTTSLFLANAATRAGREHSGLCDLGPVLPLDVRRIPALRNMSLSLTRSKRTLIHWLISNLDHRVR